MTELIEQYKVQVKLLEKRVNELKQKLCHLSGGHQDELYVRIKILNQEIDDMWDSINMMKDYQKERG